jgi:predicted deacylase
MTFLLAKPDISGLRVGNTGVEGVWQFDSGRPGRHVLVTALIHGNELCGAWALKTMLEAHVRPAAGRLTLAFCNLAAFDNFHPAQQDASRFVDEDMNRIWSPTKLLGTSQEARRAMALLPFVEQADWLLDLHSMHEPGAPLLLTGVLPRNLALARHLGAPEHIVVDAGHQDGVRLRDFGKFGDAMAQDACALLIECGFHGAPESSAVALDLMARFLSAAGTVQKGDQPGRLPPVWFAPLPSQQRAVKVTDAIVAKTGQLRFAQDWYGLQNIASSGTEIAYDGDTIFVTPYDHCTLVMPSLRQLRAGVTVVRLAQQLQGTETLS